MPPSLPFTLFLAFLISVAAGCSGYTLPEVTSPASNKYQGKAQRDGVFITVIPYLDKKTVEDFFGINLLEQHIIPLLVDIRNTTSEAYLFQKSSVTIDRFDSTKHKESTSAVSKALPEVNNVGDTIAAGAGVAAMATEAAAATAFASGSYAAGAAALSAGTIVGGAILVATPFIAYFENKKPEVTHQPA